MDGYWTGTSNDGDALVATLGDFLFNGDTRVGTFQLVRLGNVCGKKPLVVGYQYADRPFILTGSDKSYYYSGVRFNKGVEYFLGRQFAKVFRTTTVPESTLFWRLAESISIIE